MDYEKNRKNCNGRKNYKDITGQKFGKLTVLSYVGSSDYNAAMWLCRCDCGKLIVVQGRHLRSGHTRSCGCDHSSKYESEVDRILKKDNIYFYREYKFEGCKDKGYLKFDFYIPSYNLCIECQGEQHYKVVSFFGGEKAFEDRKRRDQIKRDFCKDNNIWLLEIPYYVGIDNIEKELNKEMNIIKNKVRKNSILESRNDHSLVGNC